MTTEEDPFLKMAEGRMPLPTVLGAASTVVGEGAIPRPDRSYTVLFLLSIFGGIFGLDHFYLRNPYSGLLKGLTLGGFFIWWLWDIFQLWTEKDRVLLYGMSAPFDLKMGFGQGTIAEGTTHYEQRANSSMWILAALFSFIGMDALMFSNWGMVFRKLIETLIFVMLLWSLSTAWNNSTIGIVDGLIKIPLATLFGYIIIRAWTAVAIPSLTDPVSLFTDGIQITEEDKKVLNYPGSWVKENVLISPAIQNRIMNDIGYNTITGEELKHRFEVRYFSKVEKAAEIAANSIPSTEDSQKKWPWLVSLLVFYLGGPILLLIKGIMWAVEQLPTVKAAKAAAETAAKVAAGENPLNALKEAAADTVGIELPGMPPGLAKAAEKAAKVASTVEKAKATASAAMETARGLTTNPLDAAAGVAGSMGIKLPTIPKGFKLKQEGGARHEASGAKAPGAHEEPSSQGMILGASVFALAGGAAIKLAVDYLLPQ